MSIFKRIIKIINASIPDTDDRRDYSYNEPPKRDFHKAPEVNINKEIAGYYANLEIPYDSDMITVTKAWKTLLKKYHPDLHGMNKDKAKVANEITQGINHAYKKIKEYKKG